MRSKTTLTVTILGGVTALALAGCNNNPGGTASPTTGATTTTTATSSADTVSNPLDTTKLQQDLCSGLTPAQVAPYMGQVSNSTPDKNDTSSACTLFPQDGHQANVSITVYPNMTPTAMFAGGANFPYSKKLDPIQGYPAQDTSQSGSPSGECSTNVSVADHVVVAIETQSIDGYKYHSNMCAVSEALVSNLLDNIKASR
ncbi:DUF3558 family protein [Kutzneria sp. NPDC052558]|uniref:DUF3558 family protein n=1 Tax=Kutzneria sp. NPDC052558 TaxID=3364121 RepID=UPI0037C7E373